MYPLLPFYSAFSIVVSSPLPFCFSLFPSVVAVVRLLIQFIVDSSSRCHCIYPHSSRTFDLLAWNSQSSSLEQPLFLFRIINFSMRTIDLCIGSWPPVMASVCCRCWDGDEENRRKNICGLFFWENSLVVVRKNHDSLSAKSSNIPSGHCVQISFLIGHPSVEVRDERSLMPLATFFGFFFYEPKLHDI